MELTELSIKDIHQGLVNKDFSAEELTNKYLKRITDLNKNLNAYLSVFSKEALGKAAEVDGMIAAGERIAALDGVPCAIKDNILVEGKVCTAGSKILENYIAPYNAAVITKLVKKGAIILGKTNLDEFAHGVSGEHSAYGATKNPHNPEYVSGGSSSGSAAAAAANMCAFALGSDTAGSVRFPSSFCGVVGLKPSYGAVSRYGLIAMASSLDQVGPIARNVEDAEIVFNTIKGKDPRDSTSCEPGEISKDLIEPKKIRIGIVKEALGEGIQKEVLDATKQAINKLEKEGIKTEEVSLPHLGYGVACYYIIMPSEVSSNLARYDGIKYGRLKAEGRELLDVYLETRKGFLGKEVKKRIMLGTYCLSAGYYEAYYLRAQKVRTKISQDFKKAFERFDLLLTPTSPTLPFKFGEKLTDPLSMYMEDLLTVPVNLSGLPGISIPFKKINGLPVGIQFIAPAFKERRLFEFGKFFEKIC